MLCTLTRSGITMSNPLSYLLFKTDTLPILGRLIKGKEYTTPTTAIITPELCNTHGGFKGVYLRASKSLQDQRLKFQNVIGRELGGHTEAHLLVSELLGKCGVL